jgi:hypothetical protein
MKVVVLSVRNEILFKKVLQWRLLGDHEIWAEAEEIAEHRACNTSQKNQMAAPL